MADAFVDSIGVCTHLEYVDTPYGHYDEIIKPRLLDSGIRHIRDGAAVGNTLVQNRYLDLARHGIQSTLVFGSEPMDVTIENARLLLPALDAIEGPNETDLAQFNYSYKGRKFPEATRERMKDLYGWLKGDPQLRHIPIIQSSLGWGKNAEELGNLEQYADFGSGHFYTAEALPPGDVLDSWHLKYARMVSPNKPIISTESGYSTALLGDGISEYAHARYTVRLLLEHWRKGIVRSHIYELIDEWDQPLDQDQAHFGLLRFNNTPKPAYTLIKNMIALLNDKGAAFQPSALDFTLSGGNELVHHFVLQKRDGRFYLVIWQDPKNWDLDLKKNLYAPDQTVKLTLNSPFALARTFLPMDGTHVVQSHAKPTTLDLTVPDHPLIVELSQNRRWQGPIR